MGRHRISRRAGRYAAVAVMALVIALGAGIYSASGVESIPGTAAPAGGTSSPAPLPSVSRNAVAAAGTAATGTVRKETIPARVSHFDARPGFVYLPPAARVRNSGRFPVVIALSGQSHGAGPQDVVEKGHIAAIMDQIAAAHAGRAPIVVIPDQLGPGSPNPMCVDSKLGNVATYITVDVRQWVLAHLPALPDRQDWTIAGFSEGGTCSIQLGAGYPRLFGSLADLSGESAPMNGSLQHTISTGFGGSRARYERAAPAALLAQHAPYPATRAVFTAGALDRHYGSVAPVMARRAQAAGMKVSLWVIPKAEHNWSVATVALRWAMNELVPSWDLAAHR